MVRRQLRRRGIRDERVLEAMGAVPRERFVPAESRPDAYADGALGIGFEQTISQPWIVAAICQGLALRGDERVLEVGAGSGYSAAVTALLADSVVAVERIPELAQRAARTLADLGIRNVEVVAGDGSAGFGEEAFDAIAVHAAAPEVPRGLVALLAPGGRLVVPVAHGEVDVLTVFGRDPSGAPVVSEIIGPCRFVPLIGKQGFAGSDP